MEQTGKMDVNKPRGSEREMTFKGERKEGATHRRGSRGERGGYSQAEGDLRGMLSSDMDPQDLPLETATFRGTWETHR